MAVEIERNCWNFFKVLFFRISNDEGWGLWFHTPEEDEGEEEDVNHDVASEDFWTCAANISTSAVTANAAVFAKLQSSVSEVPDSPSSRF